MATGLINIQITTDNFCSNETIHNIRCSRPGVVVIPRISRRVFRENNGGEAPPYFQIFHCNIILSSHNSKFSGFGGRNKKPM
jgi:hypothetical protein